MASENIAQFAFLRGWKQLPNGEMKAVRAEICAALGGVSLPTFYARLRGIPEPKVSEARAIEDIFKKRNITDIWGE